MNDEDRNKKEGSKAIPRPPAWALLQVWLEDEVVKAKKLADDTDAGEETRSYNLTRASILAEVERQFADFRSDSPRGR